MIFKYLNDFKSAERDIRALKYALIILFGLIVYKTYAAIYEGKYSDIWHLLTPTITCLSVLIGASVANRLIANSNIVRADDLRVELVRTTHYLIAVAKDLRQKVHYVKLILNDGNKPAIALVEISKSIQDRYEVFYDPNVYKYLPGRCIDIVTSISAQIYGIGVLAAGIEVSFSENLFAEVKHCSVSESHPTIQSLSELDSDLERLINEIFIIRDSIDKK